MVHGATSSTASSTDVENTINGSRLGITNLARQITATSAKLGHHDENNAVAPIKDSKLDPFSSNFDSYLWIKALRQLFENESDALPPRRTGAAFRRLSVYGHGTGARYQQSTGNIIPSIASSVMGRITGRGVKRVDILRDFEGVVHPGEMLLVLGPPGSGCSTFLKTLSGRTEGLNLTDDSYINFRGIASTHMHGWFRGDVLYNAEVDVHLAPLTVGDTLKFASMARVPNKVPGGFSKAEFARAYRDAIMAVFGITHTMNTKVGDDFIRGVSGGERKRVSIAEATLTGAKFQCWDNSTRGLDSGNAISFCKTLRAQADLMDVAAVVAIYQAPQSAYDTFDKVTVLYEGRQIYFGKAENAKAYFEDLGFDCPDRQTTADFLTSMTSPHERRVRPGCEATAPRTADEFAARWKASAEHAALVEELDSYERENPTKERFDEFVTSRKAERSPVQRLKSPYHLSFLQQVNLCIWRGYKRILADPAFVIASVGFNTIMGLVLGSGFYNMPENTDSFYARGAILFFTLLFNAFAGELEVLTLYIQRPVVEKHNRYAFYHQSAEAIANYITDIPAKIIYAILLNMIVYFLSNLRRTAGAFFFFLFINYFLTLTISALYRTIACVTRTAHQALVPVCLLTIGLMLYTGFSIPTDYMPGWSRWMGYVNPLSYVFEALMANEFSGREFPCTSIVPVGPGYTDLSMADRICTVVGAVAGQPFVSGDRYIELSYGFYNSHKWRNVGILFAFLVAYVIAYIVAAEFAKPPAAKGEVLMFRRGKVPDSYEKSARDDIETQQVARVIDEKPTGSSPVVEQEKNSRPSPSTCGKPVFHWENLSYEVKVQNDTLRILNNVDGWVQPGVTTALMGASGAGKTTLLDALATRLTVGVLTGDTLVNGKATDDSFSHRVGYAQQQDLHLNTTTVREALEFSALLRQSAEISRAEKLAFVDEVIKILEMESFADAVIGVPGEGLNVEQRKRLTIGVELAARPQLLVFLDEPTSGLDSQTSWAICDLIERLAKSGQAVLCTIHQPSAMLFSRFDRLLLLQPGGRTVYFGEIGPNSQTMIEYFERNGASPCPPEVNPAEWMLKSTLPSSDGPDWFETWKASPEYQEVKAELGRLREGKAVVTLDGDFDSQHKEFVASFATQFRIVLQRTFRHFWRSPTYLWSKISVTIFFALFLGFSFRGSDRSMQGVQNQLYAFFIAFLIQNPYTKQIMSFFVPQRAIYEVRERPSKIYRWDVFMLTQIFVELVWNTLCSVAFYFCWYYPVGFQNNTTDDTTIRGFLAFLFIWQLIQWASTISQAIIAPLAAPDLAGVVVNLLALLTMAFCGIGIRRDQMPAIWSDFMYWVSPMTYLASGALSTGLHGVPIECAAREIVHIPAQENMTCPDFLGVFVQIAGGRLVEIPDANACGWCPSYMTDDLLAVFNVDYGNRWRNFGLMWLYIIFNIGAGLGLYWLARVPKKQGLKRT
ncbi:ABC transporter CDR4-like protein 2 [Colletotrichum truncatum]|uniref:ABC transporter CDR4-like protein 2 n=1 Tax=Colletotrichum truncatum TaxID=5467 RepID=A0ACC3ZDJ0_COLTU|nr:ABC transporter CDR4-like protein 2 [Colletotrichum truncatum]KAF6797947.1 ABC transporter CDR4-like protein 2 [Colletotrichum truncatum]